MSVRINGKYLGNKKVELTHGPSGAVLVTTPPKDNNGDGTCFSPTDLAAASLASCTLTILAMYAEGRNISVEGSLVEVIKDMSANPRRIASLTVTIRLPRAIDQKDRQAIQKAAIACPVHRSLHPEVEQNFTFLYDVE